MVRKDLSLEEWKAWKDPYKKLKEDEKSREIFEKGQIDGFDKAKRYFDLVRLIFLASESLVDYLSSKEIEIDDLKGMIIETEEMRKEFYTIRDMIYNSFPIGNIRQLEKKLKLYPLDKLIQDFDKGLQNMENYLEKLENKLH